jgi:hypothetical protein
MYNAGPWIDGSMQTRIGEHILFDVYGGGGWMRKGYGMIVQKTLISSLSGGAPTSTSYYEYDTSITCNFLTTFVGLGPCYNHLDKFFISLTAGYAFNKQLWSSIQHVVPYKHMIKNKWQSPYIGIGSGWSISDCLRFDINYKALVGHADSIDELTLNGNNLSNTCRFVPKFFGNIVSLDIA